MTRYVITFEPIHDPTDPQGIRRLRRLLKSMLRAYGLKCVDARGLPVVLAATGPAAGQGAAQ